MALTTNSVEISKYVLRASREYRYWSFSCFTFAFDKRSFQYLDRDVNTDL